MGQSGVGLPFGTSAFMTWLRFVEACLQKGGGQGCIRVALEGKGPQRRSQKR